MKLVCLNLWGGKQGRELFDYLQQQSQDADIFCFQEVFSSTGKVDQVNNVTPHLLQKLQGLLVDFNCHFTPVLEGYAFLQKVNFDIREGLAIFVRKSLAVESYSDKYIHSGKIIQISPDLMNLPAKIQHVGLKFGNKQLIIFNLHGLAFPGDKLDTAERLEQSKKIINFVKNFSGPKIVCGDFNLMPQTESLKMIQSELNMKNLITELNIKSTRNEASWKQFAEEPDYVKQYFADFIFVSPEIKVNNFEVPYNEVSDHLPMLLDFSL